MSTKMNLNLDWRFHLGDETGADFMGWDDSAWRVVTLPHDWSVEHPFDRAHASGTGYLPGGTAWYRKHFVLPADVSGKRVRITFGGVYKHARVWINSNYLGQRPYGYATFTHDITEFVRPGENVICVRVEHNEVADSRWFTGSGIYRDVTLEITGLCAFATDGIFVTTQKVENGTATLKVQYETLGADGAEFALQKPCGCVVAQAQATGECGSALLTVPEAMLWSPGQPTLYRLVASAVRDGAVTDENVIPVGIRTIRFDCDKGFFLNGVSTKLKGVCVHHDAGCLGAAVPRAVWARRLQTIKASGCNALRTAHNPPDSLLLDLCDELGLLVMDEAFDEWEGTKNKWWQGHNVYPPKRFGYAEDFPQWHRADLEGMVKRDRNHPCIVMWSIGNEIDYPNDPYVTPLFREVLGNNDANKPLAERLYDVRKPDAGRLATMARELTGIVHALDTTRPVTSALSFPELSTRTGYADALDASGYNYKEQFYAEDHARFPERVIFGSENSHSPEAWYAVRDHEYICGQFLWTGVDFLGECRGWPVRISQAGMLDLAGYEKPLYAQRKALWTTEPYVRIAVCDAAAGHREAWSQQFCWAGEEGRMMEVSCYTNAPRVELFLNGCSLGVKEIGDHDGCRAVWQVPYQPGELRAVAGGAQDVLCSTGKAETLCLRSDVSQLKADGQSIAQVEVTLYDAQGQVAVSDDECVRYQLLGDAQILGIENGRPDDLTPYAESFRHTYHGRALVYIRAGRMADSLVLRAYTRSGLRAECALMQQ
ncbi:MAG: glycoside hydrolase family 2 TIM barrel-domain containing protein [Clostridia bacterium]|nr:glycoside hydrolase family 2 TIM barrel-domain containing protein [Clostridia bacterium]